MTCFDALAHGDAHGGGVRGLLVVRGEEHAPRVVLQVVRVVAAGHAGGTELGALLHTVRGHEWPAVLFNGRVVLQGRGRAVGGHRAHLLHAEG